MHTIRALVLSAILSIAGVSAIAIESSLTGRSDSTLQAKATNTCRVENEKCKNNLDCCSTFYCAGFGAGPQDYKCHSDGVLGGGTARCNANSQCLSGECKNQQCTQPFTEDDGDDDDGLDDLFR